MATSGSFNTTAYYGDGSDYVRYLTFSWSRTSYSVANNTSTISWTLKGAGGSSTSHFYYGNVKLVIAGETVYSRESRELLYNGTVVASGSYTFTHNDNGTKSFSVSAEAGIYTYAVNCTGSASFTLDTIARASQPSLVTYPDSTANVGAFGETFSIHMNRKSSSFTHTVRYAYGNRSGTIATGVGTGTTWAVPLDFMNDIPAATSASGLIYVDTYSGSTFVGTKYTGFTVTVPASVKPSCTFVLEDITGVDDIYGSPVKGLSKIKVTVSATTAYSSPIASYKITANGATYSGSSATTGVLQTSGTSRVTATVTDKRGRIGSVSYDMNVQNYTTPAVTALSVRRCDSDGTVNDQGEYVKATFSAAVSSMSSKNTAEYTLKYKKSAVSTYTTVPLTALKNTYSVSDHTYIFAADGSSSYDVDVSVTDNHGTASRSASASTAFTTINFHNSGTGLRFGGVAEKENTFQVSLDAEFDKSISAKGGIFLEDTRDVNLLPYEYRGKGRGVYYEFKQCKYIDLYDVLEPYCVLVTYTQWDDVSGGSVKQVSFSKDRIWYRYGDENTWGAWKPILYHTDWTNVANGIMYRVHNGMCTVRGNSTSFSISPSGVHVCTLPDNVWPSVEIFGSLTTKANTCGQVTIGTNGYVTLWNLGATSNYWAFTITYPLW